MFQRGETIMRIKSMMKGMLAVVMAMSMAACSGAPAADQTSSESPAQTESTAATEQETIVTEVSAETQTQEETAKAPKYVFCLLVMVYRGSDIPHPAVDFASLRSEAEFYL